MRAYIGYLAIYLGMIARMARLNVEETPKEGEFTEVMQTILAASTLEEDS